MQRAWRRSKPVTLCWWTSTLRRAAFERLRLASNPARKVDTPIAPSCSRITLSLACLCGNRRGTRTTRWQTRPTIASTNLECKSPPCPFTCPGTRDRPRCLCVGENHPRPLPRTPWISSTGKRWISRTTFGRATGWLQNYVVVHGAPRRGSGAVPLLHTFWCRPKPSRPIATGAWSGHKTCRLPAHAHPFRGRQSMRMMYRWKEYELTNSFIHIVHDKNRKRFLIL